MTVEFLAALQGSTVIKMDGDGSGYLKLAFDAKQGLEVIKLLACTEQLLRIRIETEGG